VAGSTRFCPAVLHLNRHMLTTLLYVLHPHVYCAFRFNTPVVLSFLSPLPPLVLLSSSFNASSFLNASPAARFHHLGLAPTSSQRFMRTTAILPPVRTRALFPSMRVPALLPRVSPLRSLHFQAQTAAASICPLSRTGAAPHPRRPARTQRPPTPP
jgi:hypothetical protein